MILVQTSTWSWESEKCNCHCWQWLSGTMILLRVNIIYINKRKFLYVSPTFGTQTHTVSISIKESFYLCICYPQIWHLHTYNVNIKKEIAWCVNFSKRILPSLIIKNLVRRANLSLKNFARHPKLMAKESCLSLKILS